MDISKLNNNKFVDDAPQKKRVDKHSSAGDVSANKPGSAEQVHSKKTDQLSLSDEASKITEQELALRAYDKLKTDSFSKLGEIKSKIDAGAYNASEVHSNVRKGIHQQLQALEKSLEGDTISEDPKIEQLTSEKKQFLLEDPQVQRAVSEEIAKSISKL